MWEKLKKTYGAQIIVLSIMWTEVFYGILTYHLHSEPTELLDFYFYENGILSVVHLDDSRPVRYPSPLS